MANGTNGNGTRTKSATNYEPLLEESEVRRDGWSLRDSKSMSEVRRLLSNVDNREAIMQVFERALDVRAKFNAAKADVARYERLIHAQKIEAAAEAAEAQKIASAKVVTAS
jgi:hypothetical protein